MNDTRRANHGRQTMELHHGRMFDHVHLQVRDLEASKRFHVV
ncbi:MULTISPECIES: hypothetical protein [Corallococcus]|nr:MULTISPECIES: hypothetical protein [Corallococcus]